VLFDEIIIKMVVIDNRCLCINSLLKCMCVCLQVVCCSF